MSDNPDDLKVASPRNTAGDLDSDDTVRGRGEGGKVQVFDIFLAPRHPIMYINYIPRILWIFSFLGLLGRHLAFSSTLSVENGAVAPAV